MAHLAKARVAKRPKEITVEKLRWRLIKQDYCGITAQTADSRSCIGAGKCEIGKESGGLTASTKLDNEHAINHRPRKNATQNGKWKVCKRNCTCVCALQSKLTHIKYCVRTALLCVCLSVFFSLIIIRTHSSHC